MDSSERPDDDLQLAAGLTTRINSLGDDRRPVSIEDVKAVLDFFGPGLMGLARPIVAERPHSAESAGRVVGETVYDILFSLSARNLDWPNRWAFWKYLEKTLRRRCVKELKAWEKFSGKNLEKYKLHPSMYDDESLESETAEDCLCNVENKQFIDTLFSLITPKQRIMLIMRHYRGMQAKDVREAMSVNRRFTNGEYHEELKQIKQAGTRLMQAVKERGGGTSV